ncbi:MAG: ATP-binding cassette domain-containing protein [Campylobacter sp.]|nr:ATP-binding cassette domain-containing protein [Campylobacter sp.]
MLEVKNLSKSFIVKKHWYLKEQSILVFQNLNFSLNLGQNLAIFGESGSGKSTLARILCSLELPSSGEVLYRGENLYTQKQKSKTKIQYLFQEQKLALNPYKYIKTSLFDVYDYCGLKRDEKELFNLFSSFELNKDLLGLKPLQLSGGEAARIGLIRALILKPEFLILDELTSSLDIMNIEKILGFLKKYQENNTISYIFITHQEEFLKNFKCEKMKL